MRFGLDGSFSSKYWFDYYWWIFNLENHLIMTTGRSHNLCPNYLSPWRHNEIQIFKSKTVELNWTWNLLPSHIIFFLPSDISTAIQTICTPGVRRKWIPNRILLQEKNWTSLIFYFNFAFWVYSTWPLKKKVACRQATRGPIALNLLQGIRQWR